MRICQIFEKKDKPFRPLFLLVAAGLIFSVFILNHFTQSESFADQAQLSNADCVKCHAAVAGWWTARGANIKPPLAAWTAIKDILRW